MRHLFLLSFIILWSCSSHKSEQAGNISPDITAQNIIKMKFSNYADLWQKVKEYEKKGLTKSAYETVKAIYSQAKKDHNTPQIIKSLLYQSKYMMQLEEDSELKIVRRFKDEIKQSDAPEKNILESYLAQMYWQYYQSHRYKFAKRTETTGKVDIEDFRTWDLKTLFKEVYRHFDHSLQNPELLKKLPVSQWQDILEISKESQKYEPVLYDVLVHEALHFYQTDEHTLTAPAYKFTIDNPDYLSDVQKFINLKLASKDSLSLQFKALELYQSYLKHRLQDPNHSDALAYADLQRLKFVYSKAILSKKGQIYLKTLKDFVKNYQQSDVAALALYEQASLLSRLGNAYHPVNKPEVRWYKKQALEICEKTILEYPKSHGAALCKTLSFQIKQITLALDAEKNIPEQKPALIKLTYKNLSQAQLKLYKIQHRLIDDLLRLHDQDKKRHFIEQLPLQKKLNISLQNDGDFQSHSTEHILDGLPNGEYIAYLSAPESGQNTFAFSIFQVTDVALQSIAKTSQKSGFLVYDRSNGKAYPNAQVKIEKRLRNQTWQQVKQTKTNRVGEFVFQKNPRYYNDYLFEITYGPGKKAYFQDYLRNIYQPTKTEAFNTAFIFTDRGIYRPGQTLYFKSICLTKMAKRSKVLSHQLITVSLYDANRQKIGRKTLTTNDFGSVSGEFILPKQTLPGLFTLEISAKSIGLFNSKNILVEYYKRPKFEVVLNKPEKTYKVNDLVSLTGKAQSFAGTNITDAKVVYRVKREVIMPRWWFWYRSAFSAEAQEITHGTTQTDARGNFVIEFKALPDLSVKPDNHPVFHYTVYAEVTDINGETRQAQTGVKVGYQSLIARLDLPGRIQKNKMDTIVVKTTNLNDVAVPAKGKLSIYKLKAPQKVLRTRPWPEPDFQSIPRSRFEKFLPHMPYTQKETNPVFWDKEKEMYQTNFDTGKQEKLLFKPAASWPSGKYLAVIKTKDKDGQEVSDKQVFDIYSPTEKTIADYQFLAVRVNRKTYQPGDVMQLDIGSAGKGSMIRIWVEKARRIILEKTFKTDGTYKTLTVPVTKNDFGGFAVHYAFAAYNAYKYEIKTIEVPYPSKELEIETITFRDKLKPGQQEEWRFKIKGKQAGKITAEVLASMYDMSLDQFVKHQWSFNPIDHIYYQPVLHIKPLNAYGKLHLNLPIEHVSYYTGNTFIKLAQLNWFGFRLGHYRNYYSLRSVERKAGGIPIAYPTKMNAAEAPVAEADMETNHIETTRLSDKAQPETHQETPVVNVSPRTNFNETAFFYPNLYTDKQGNVSFGFTAPESLTKWKLQLLAHTKDLSYAYKKLTAQTQKDLMVFPNAPRFVREGDVLIFSTKISNLTAKNLQGTAMIQFLDAVKQKDVTKALLSEAASKTFRVDAKGNIQVSWSVKVPENLEALQYKITAKAGNQSDGEQNLLPVLSNRMLVTETLPMWVRSGQTKTFVLNKLLHNQSATLKNHRLTLEITSNPAWYAVQAMPYLMEYPYECSEQTFSRYYANTLAAHIVHQNPKIKQVFDIWKNYDSDALLSNLEKNQELKSIIIEETPWLRDAESETEQKKRIALLFDLNKMAYAQQTTLQKLAQMQLPDGGFTWFKGGRYSNRYITRHIVAGFGHLRQLGVDVLAGNHTRNMVHKAIKFLDDEILKDYKALLKQSALKGSGQDFLKKYHPGAAQIHYLYARSFYPEVPVDGHVQTAVDYYRRQAQKYWLSYGLYEQGLIALMSHRHGDATVAKAIIRSLDENSIKSDELGMYWKNNTGGWYWYQAPIETQALLIEAFDAIDGDVKKLDEMRIWLLKHKQTNAWKTTKQTTEAVYALLLRGSDWLSLTDNVSVKIGKIKIDPAQMPDIKTEAGTGYLKKSWTPEQITPDMAKVTIHKKDKGVAWGALYWQYFEDLDKITNAKTPVAITKDLFIRHFTDTGEKITKITPGTKIKIGDLVRVRIEIKVDRPMEYVHLKDMRAAGFEPLNVISAYRWQDGLGYYEATGDAATNFFISRLPKGVYVFEYDLRANNAGSYSNGITTLQSMYAPEFSSHSKGQHVEIGK